MMRGGRGEVKKFKYYRNINLMMDVVSHKKCLSVLCIRVKSTHILHKLKNAL